MRWYLKYLLIFIGIFLLCIIYLNIFLPSKISVVASCNPDKFQEKYSQVYSIVGKTTVNFSEKSNEEPSVELFKQDLPTLKHEQCHVRQFTQNRFFGCNNKIGMYINEVECYFISSAYELLE